MSVAEIKTAGSVKRQPRRVYYPASDGKPMGETDQHMDVLSYCKDALRDYFADRADSVYVSGNNFIYYQEGSSRARVSPDVYVVFGIPQRQRESYFPWRESGQLPAIVFEITSRKTRREDEVTKRDLYERVLAVPEYVLFDPKDEYLRPRFQMFRLREGRYEAVPVIDNRMYSEQLGLELVADGNRLRFFDPQTGEFLPSLAEMRIKAAAEAEAREQVQAENARLRAELDALRRERSE